MIIQGIHTRSSRSILLVVCTTVANVLCRLFLEIMFIALNDKRDLLQSL